MSETTRTETCWDCRGNRERNGLRCAACRGTGQMTVTVITRTK